MTSEETVLVRRDGQAGHLVLNRPSALNSLNRGMVERLDAALTDWESDPGVTTVVISGAGSRGLCAGGDIRAIWADARTPGGGTESEAFWRHEYRLNGRIARYTKPYVAVMDGIVMGGGVGLSAHGSVRIVTERSQVAMPETGIGFVPDVGGTYLLSRAPGECGTHLALTGSPVGAADAVWCGLADHLVPSERLPELLADLAGAPADEVVARYALPLPEAELAAHRAWMDLAYAADTVEEIVARLTAAEEAEAREAAATIAGRSPLSLKVTLAAMRRARAAESLEEVLAQDHLVSCAALRQPDFVEGVRAQVIDKDRAPRWNPATLEEVTQEMVEEFFRPRP